MNNVFKKLAFMMALTMTVATAAPAAQASAAATPVLNTTSKKLYMETDVATGKYSNTLTLKVWNLGDYRVTFESSNPEVATVNKWWGTVTTVAPGEATITATISNKTTGKVVKTLTSKVWVKRNATDIGFSTASAAKFNEALAIGDKAKLNVFRTDADGNTAWSQADKTKVTDYIIWTSSDEKVATVDKWGTVTAVGAGEATITAKSVQTEDATVATTEEETIKVTVKAEGITAVKQTTASKIELTVGSDLSEVIKADTLVVTPSKSSVQTPVVKSVKWNDEKTVATVEFYTELTDKEAYAIAVTGNDDLKGEFVASVGEVAAITITGPTTAVVNTTTDVEYTLTDANGIEVTSSKNVTLAVIENELNGYVDETGCKVTVFEKGKNVVVQATYHTGTYTNEGEEVVIKSNAFVVTGMDKTDATLTTTKYTISDTTTTVDWDNYTENLRVTMGDYTQKLNVYAKDSLKTEHTAFKFESMDETKLVVGTDGSLSPVAEGTVYVKVTVTDIDKTFLVKVTVAGQKKLTTVSLDKYSATLSNVSLAADTTTATITLKDQFGDEITSGYTVDVELSDGTALKEGVHYTVAKDEVTLIGAGFTGDAKSYPVKITVTYNKVELSRVITLAVKTSKTNVATSYKLEASKTAVDMSLNNSNQEGITVDLDLIGYDANGVKVVKVAADDAKLDISTKVPGVTTAATGSAVVIVKDTNGVLTKEGKVGTYVATATYTDAEGKNFTSKVSFVVTDTQIKPVVVKNETEVKLATGNALDAVKAAFEAKTSNKSKDVVITGVEYTVNGVANGTVKAGDTIVISKIKVTETFKEGNTFTHTITVNNSLKLK